MVRNVFVAVAADATQPATRTMHWVYKTMEMDQGLADKALDARVHDDVDQDTNANIVVVACVLVMVVESVVVMGAAASLVVLDGHAEEADDMMVLDAHTHGSYCRQHHTRFVVVVRIVA